MATPMLLQGYATPLHLFLYQFAVRNFHSQFLCIANTIRIKRFVQERSGKDSAKNGERSHFIYLALLQSASQKSVSGS